jgi:magnesium-transporting ATPase (P-type)
MAEGTREHRENHPSVASPWQTKISLNKDNLLLRGCTLRNTDFIEGMVVYAGNILKVRYTS